MGLKWFEVRLYKHPQSACSELLINTVFRRSALASLAIPCAQSLFTGDEGVFALMMFSDRRHPASAMPLICCDVLSWCKMTHSALHKCFLSGAPPLSLWINLRRATVTYATLACMGCLGQHSWPAQHSQWEKETTASVWALNRASKKYIADKSAKMNRSKTTYEYFQLTIGGCGLKTSLRMVNRMLIICMCVCGLHIYSLLCVPVNVRTDLRAVPAGEWGKNPPAFGLVSVCRKRRLHFPPPELRVSVGSLKLSVWILSILQYIAFHYSLSIVLKPFMTASILSISSSFQSSPYRSVATWNACQLNINRDLIQRIWVRL